VTNPFPNLQAGNHSITSASDSHYNCFAWAVNYTDRWLDPEAPFGYWPTGITLRLTLNNLTAIYAEHGYSRCDSPDVEAGYEKIAIYTDRRGLPTHAARQLSNGRWSSKLGELEDIEHHDLQALEGPGYGSAVRYLRRTLMQATATGS